MTRMAVMAVVVCATFWGIGTSTPVKASEDKNAYPHMITCEVAGVRHFGWLDRVEADGSAVYLTPSGKFATVSKNGVMTIMGTLPGSCGGKTMDELIASGKARFIGK